ncbi:unnamed protein product, partial [marine sediment metagenome]
NVNDQVIRTYNMGSGMTELEDIDVMVKNVTIDNFDIWDSAGIAPINSSAFGVFTQGSVIYDIYEVNQPDYDPSRETNANQVEVRYKIVSEATQGNPVWRGVRMKEGWDIFDAEFGRDRIIAICPGQTQNQSVMAEMLDSGGCRRRVDFISTAPYFNLSTGGNYPIPGFTSWANMTPKEATDYVINGDFPEGGNLNRLDGILRMIKELGAYRYMTYEGGDHSNTTSAGDKADFLREWAYDDEMQRCYQAYYKRLRDIGATEHCIYTMAIDEKRADVNE